MIRASSLLALLLLTAPAKAAYESVEFPRFTDGLCTNDSANVVPPTCLVRSNNVLLDEDADGIPVRRRGFAKYNPTAITNTKTVRGLWAFDANDGTKYLIAVSSAHFYHTAGNGVWTVLTGHAGFSSSSEWDCTSALGRFWCVDGSSAWYWNATTTAAVSAIQAGSNKIDNFRNRVVTAGGTAEKARIRLSGELDGEDYTIPTTAFSTSPANIAVGGVNDGNEVTCLMGVYQDVLTIGKADSIWGLYGFDRDDFALREISREVGCIDDKSVKEKGGCLYWLSKRGYEKMCGGVIDRVSDRIKDQLDVLIESAGNTVTVTDTTQTDFEAGVLAASGPGALVSATQIPASIQMTTFSATDTSASDFGAGTLANVTTATVSGSVVLVSSRVFDTFSDGDYTSGPVWVSTGGDTVAIVSGYLDPNGADADGISLTAGGTNNAPITRLEASAFIDPGAGSPFTGVGWELHWGPDMTGTAFGTIGYRLVASRDSIGGINTLTMSRISVGATTTLLTITGALSADTTHQIAITRSVNGTYEVFVDSVSKGSVADTTYSTSTKVMAYVGYSLPNATRRYSLLDNIAVEFGYVSSGTFSSQAFDTALSTPTWGLLTVSSSVPTSTILTYDIQTATSSSGDWDETLNVANATATFAATQRRYVRYRANFSNTVSSQTPQLDNANLTASTTGYFIGQCRQPASTISGWGLFSCTAVDNGGSFTFYTTTGSSCNQVTRASATWTTQPNNQIVAVTTGTFFAYRALFSLDVGTDTPTIQDCSISWDEGATRPPLSTAVYKDRLYIAYTSSTLSGAANDHILVLDSNDKWTIFDNHDCYSLGAYQRALYCGASTASGQVWRMDIGTDDDGEAYTSLIRTPSYHFESWDRKKVFKNLYLLLDPSPDSAQTITLTAAYIVDRGTQTYSLGTVDLNESPASVTTAKFPASLSNPVAGRFFGFELQNTGTNAPWRLFGSKLYYELLDPD